MCGIKKNNKVWKLTSKITMAKLLKIVIFFFILSHEKVQFRSMRRVYYVYPFRAIIYTYKIVSRFNSYNNM